MTLEETLKTLKLTHALIIDDGYDAVPHADDIADDDDAWANFFDDIGDDREELTRIFPPFAALEVDQLRHSNDFVSAVWNARATLRPELWNLLLSTYEQTKKADRAFLEKLEPKLRTLGIEPIPSGREIPIDAKNVGLVFADLFLGSTQDANDVKTSIAVLRSFIQDREENPPIVVLMSRSNLLEDRKAEFRDGAKLLGAMFRVHRKQELIEGGTLVRTLGRLVQHQPDALKVAGFLDSWKNGLADASERFLTGIRSLDLSDYAQIREVLLTFEGQPLGSYLLDVFDRVLQHEIEGDQHTIAAAERLNEIDPSCYPPPYISGSSDLLGLVYRTILQNPHRLAVKTTIAKIPVGFGDVLIKRKQEAPGPVPSEISGAPMEGPITEAGVKPESGTKCAATKEREPDALLVITPACDLVRETGAKRILFVAGKLSELTHERWHYHEDEIKTPIVVLPGERRLWIRWKPKDLRALLISEIEELLKNQDGYEIAIRLRESHALELQQRILASMGRVGILAQMPATFSVAISAFFKGADGKFCEIALPIAARDGGVVYTGRDSDGEENSRLVLTEPVVDEILDVIGKLDEKLMHGKAKNTLARLKASTSLQSVLERGIDAPSSSQHNYSPISVPAGVNDKGKVVTETVGLIARNPAADKSPDLAHCCFVLVLKDAPIT